MTHPVLFSNYKNAETHYIKENENINDMYDFQSNLEESKKMIAKIETKKLGSSLAKKGLGKNQYKIKLELYTDKNYKGDSYIYDRTYDFDRDDPEHIIKIIKYKNKISSFKYKLNSGHALKQVTFELYADAKAIRSYSGKWDINVNISSLPHTAIPKLKNDDLEKVRFKVTK